MHLHPMLEYKGEIKHEKGFKLGICPRHGPIAGYQRPRYQ